MIWAPFHGCWFMRIATYSHANPGISSTIRLTYSFRWAWTAWDLFGFGSGAVNSEQFNSAVTSRLLEECWHFCRCDDNQLLGSISRFFVAFWVPSGRIYPPQPSATSSSWDQNSCTSRCGMRGIPRSKEHVLPVSWKPCSRGTWQKQKAFAGFRNYWNHGSGLAEGSVLFFCGSYGSKGSKPHDAV